MATSCFFCNKHADNGNNVSHAKNRTKRLRRPNLHNKNLQVDGVRRRVAICSSCLKRLNRPAVPAQV
ncbi:MAG: 50S ribosomal protein L28 [Candidatus Woesebacteria bacterium]